MGRTGRGYTLAEILIAMVTLAILGGLSIPGFTGFVQRSRLDGAARQIVSDVREARAKATLTGWQYRIFGFNYGASSSFKNQYRLMARSSGAVAWPADTAAPFESATQMAGVWINMSTLYPGVRINPNDGTPRFWVVFDARGVDIADNSFSPLEVTHQAGGSRNLRVTTVGSIRID